MSVDGGQASSRESAAGAGWRDCGGPGAWKADVPPDARPLSWMRPATLWASRNDVLAKRLYDPVDRARIAWARMARARAERAGHNPDFVTRRGDGDSVSFLLRGDSLARFSQLYDKRLAGGCGRLALAPAEAATYMGELLGIAPTRGRTVEPSARARRAAKLIAPLPAAHGLHRLASEFFDWNDPPFFKQFLRLDAEPGRLRVRCFGVSGCARASLDPPVEDEISVPL